MPTDPETAPTPGRQPADAALLRMADGDRDAVPELYDLLATTVHSAVLAVVRDRTMAEEVVQEVFVELWRTAGRFDPARGSARTWTLTLAHRRAVDRVRREQSLRDRTTRAALRDRPVARDVVSEEVATTLDAERVDRALDELSPLQRESIELAYLGGRTYREIATMLDVPLGTVRTRLRDGLRSLRTTMGVTP